MLFHTPQFVLFFLILIPFFAVGKALGRAPWVLLIFSQVFYASWDWRFLILLWTTIVLDYVLALRIHDTPSPALKRAYLVLSITASLSLLGFFKYWNFIMGSLSTVGLQTADSLKIASIILPVGISFYTFQSMGYVIDVYRGAERPIRNPVNYAAFVCYFPHMVAGPIMRIGRLLPQLVRPAPMTVDRLISGLMLFSYGFACKALGDVLGSQLDPVFSALSKDSPYAPLVFAVIGFGFQIYFDFLGYTEMARGISRVLGIELMRNFRAPYTSTSFREFWRRWHVSLSEWLRDYVYISLGGNRSGLPIRVRNLLITMLLGGIWHGAGWNFLIWGGLQGSYLALNTVYASLIGRYLPTRGIAGAVRSGLGWLLTIVCVMYAWLYFRLGTFDQAMLANQKIWLWLNAPKLPDVTWGVVICVLAFFLVDVLRRNAEDVFPLEFVGVRRNVAFGLLSGAFVTLGLLFIVGAPTQQFIYFQF